jgi:hypothetical protein
MSESIMAQYGPGPMPATSTIFTPASGPTVNSLLLLLTQIRVAVADPLSSLSLLLAQIRVGVADPLS